MQSGTLPFKLTVCGIDELSGHGKVASHVLSILDPTAPVPEAFGSFGEHAKVEFRFDDIIEDTPGLIAPGLGDVEQILVFGRELMMQSQPDAHLLIHCHAGISRSTAAMVLILAQALPEETATSIIGRVHALREKAWPNLRMIEYGDALLQRNGTLVEAAAGLYQLQLEKRPQLAAFMEKSGRQRELLAAAGCR